MKNPWTELPFDAPYVLPEDLPFVEAFNADATPKTRIRAEAVPEPFFGRFDAPVVVLMLNPGFDPAGVNHVESEAHIAQLRHSITHGDQSHLHLRAGGEGNGVKWWTRATSALANATSRHSVAERILTLEFSPYHSIQFAHGHVRFPSQVFTFDLLESAIMRKCEVVIARGRNWWVGAVPNLWSYRRVHIPSNSRQSALSAGNLGTESFSQIVAAIARNVV